MQSIIDLTNVAKDVDTDEWTRLRKGLLFIEREKTRVQGRRTLERLSELNHAEISPLAESGLASSFYWSGNLRDALHWSKHTVANYPMTTAAVWSLTMLISLYRTLGMKRERFEAERERLLLMKRIAFQSENRSDRIYVLSELLKELESRDLPDDAKKYAQELEALMGDSYQESSVPA